MPRPKAEDSEHKPYPENFPTSYTNGLSVSFWWEDLDGKQANAIIWMPAAPRKGDKVYVLQSWDEPMEVEDVHWDAVGGRVYVYLID